MEDPESQSGRGLPRAGRERRQDRFRPNPKAKLLDQVREVMRVWHYSLRTERSYGDWIRRYVKFHGMRSREDLEPAEAKVEAFLSHLAVEGEVAASTQNQAFNALLFLYREVLDRPLESIQAVRADRPVRVPTVLTVEEARQVIGVMSGSAQLVVKIFDHDLHTRAPAGRPRGSESAGWMRASRYRQTNTEQSNHRTTNVEPDAPVQSAVSQLPIPNPGGVLASVVHPLLGDGQRGRI